jgi:diadenosine tetraphosphate (Ap4A) HIT family hydrolase
LPHITPQQRIELARKGANPAAICQLPSGWVFLADMQYLPGYCILMADPLVESINALSELERSQFLCDMVRVGDVLMEVTGACRINYAIFGNSDPVLHAHIVPRYADEPPQYLHNVPWSYPQEQMEAIGFDANRDSELMQAIMGAIQRRMGSEKVKKFDK